MFWAPRGPFRAPGSAKTDQGLKTTPRDRPQALAAVGGFYWMSKEGSVETEVFRNFRRQEAIVGLQDSQKTIQDEKAFLGTLSGLPGTAY